MKKTILTILVLALALGVSAQKRNEKQGEKIAIGIKVGGNLSQYHYYPDPYALNSLGFDSIGKRLNPMFGLNVEIPLLNGVVLISPEVVVIHVYLTVAHGKPRSFIVLRSTTLKHAFPLQ